ncbi:hypothetical protein AAFF_G00279890 [Aldrovandia affinis]|uniref:Ig-like domain-containing protein n=1 Tax=Aldrovandia affinis TaxID=143900 RepID=A0AAD7WSI5_9TELE|nr:hypothetical protein AAFF_G00279890 [Aldrovandia affinis]
MAGEFASELILPSNGNFTLRPNIKGSLEDILWKWNDDKIIEFDQTQVYQYGQFKGRTILDFKTGDFTLQHLKVSDSGKYRGELQIAGQLHYYEQTVKVLDALDKPAVTCQVNDNGTVTLLCAGDQSPLTQYSWEGPDTQDQPGYELQIRREESQSSDSVYTCVVKNPVSENREDFPVKSCFPAQGNAHTPDVGTGHY